MKKIFSTLISFGNQHVWVTFFALRANKIIKKQLPELEQTEFSVNLFANKFEDVKKTIDAFNQEHLERKKILEEKARALLLIVTASATLTTGILTFVYNLQGQHAFLLSLLILGYVFLILCIFDVLATLNTTEYYYINGNDYFRPVGNTTEIEYNNINDKVEYIERLYRNTQLNSRKNLIKQNHLYAAFENLRNGVLLICVFFIISIVLKMINNNNEVSVESIQSIAASNASEIDSTRTNKPSFPLEGFLLYDVNKLNR